MSGYYCVRTNCFGRISNSHIIFLEDIDRLRILKKQSLDGPQPFSGGRPFHLNDSETSISINLEM